MPAIIVVRAILKTSLGHTTTTRLSFVVEVVAQCRDNQALRDPHVNAIRVFDVRILEARIALLTLFCELHDVA